MTSMAMARRWHYDGEVTMALQTSNTSKHAQNAMMLLCDGCPCAAMLIHLLLNLSATVYILAEIRSITSCVCDVVLIMWWLNEHMHLHLCRFMFIMLCASPPPLVRSPRSALLY